MNLTWHIVRKDLYRLRPWLALVIGVTVLRYVNFYAPGYDPEHDKFFGSLYRAEVIENILLVLSILATALAAAPLVHEDPVTGYNAFWLTRPISGGRLLAAKTITFTLALVLLPFAVQLGWWLLHRYTVGDIIAQLPPVLARQAGIAFAGFWFALVTRDLGSFVLAGTISVLGISAAHVFLINGWLRLPSRADDYNRVILELIVALVVLPMLIVHQYRTRHTRRTLVLFGGLLALCLGIYAAWPWRVFARTAKFDSLPALGNNLPTTAAAGTPVPILYSGPDRVNGVLKSSARKVPVLAFDLTIDRIPAGHVVQILTAAFHRTATSSEVDALHLMHDQRITLRRPVQGEDYSTRDQLLLDTPEITAPIEAELMLALRRLETTAALPLVIGASGERGPYYVRIADIKNLQGESSITRSLPDGRQIITKTTYTAQKFALLLDEALPSALLSVGGEFAERDRDQISSLDEFPIDFAANQPRHGYFLVSRRDGVVTRADNIVVHAKVSVDGVRRRQVRAEFPLRLRATDLRDYDLVKITSPLVGTFTRAITFPATRHTAAEEPAGATAR